MYEKPELTLVGSAATLVLGSIAAGDDSDVSQQLGAEGVTQGLDD